MTLNYENIRNFLFREARLLDDKDFDAWLECYAKDAEVWVPSWDDDDKIVSDPQSEISLMYYPRRDGLEDRVFRIRTEKSSASWPPHRTSHNISNIEITETDGNKAEVRFNWVTFAFRYKKVNHYFGTSFYTLALEGGEIYIKKKKAIVKNDYIHQVLDIYHI